MTNITHAPALSAPVGAPLDPCQQCAAPLAPDQRWCLNCGRRREGVDTPFTATATPVAAAPAPAPLAAVARSADRTPRWLYGVLGVAAAVILFVLGLVIGTASKDRRTLVNIPAAAAPVVNVTVPAGGAAAASSDDAASAFTSDWPDGKDGWTVQLSKLPTEGTDAAAVAAAKSAAEGKGAADVGALLSDDYASLPASRYIVYSGVFGSKAKATAALKGLRKDFPKAKVVQVSATGDDDEPVAKAPKNTGKLSPDQFQKQSKKLPDKVGTEGTPPPVDKSKPAGGGSEGTTIG